MRQTKIVFILIFCPLPLLSQSVDTNVDMSNPDSVSREYWNRLLAGSMSLVDLYSDESLFQAKENVLMELDAARGLDSTTSRTLQEELLGEKGNLDSVKALDPKRFFIYFWPTLFKKSFGKYQNRKLDVQIIGSVKEGHDTCYVVYRLWSTDTNDSQGHEDIMKLKMTSVGWKVIIKGQ